MNFTLCTLDGNRTICIENLPGRKNKSLYRQRGAHIVIMANFRDDVEAAWMEEFLTDLSVLVSEKK